MPAIVGQRGAASGDSTLKLRVHDAACSFETMRTPGSLGFAGGAHDDNDNDSVDTNSDVVNAADSQASERAWVIGLQP